MFHGIGRSHAAFPAPIPSASCTSFILTLVSFLCATEYIPVAGRVGSSGVRSAKEVDIDFSKCSQRGALRCPPPSPRGRPMDGGSVASYASMDRQFGRFMVNRFFLAVTYTLQFAHSLRTAHSHHSLSHTHIRTDIRDPDS